MLRLIDIHTYYGKTHVLWGISLEVKQGSVVALLGRNGVGKTTIIRSIISFTPPRHGVVEFNGKDITRLRPNRIAQMGLGLIPQGRRIFPSLTVEENLTMSARNEENRETWSLDNVYSLFPILRERARVKGTLLSGGEQQMLSIGRALMTNPRLLLMDEPSEGLSPVIIRELSSTIHQLNKSGLSILLVEQNFRLVQEVGSYVYVISRGVVVYEATPAELEMNEEVKAKYLAISK